MNTVGIDVGCKELVLVEVINGKSRKAKLFENMPLGHQSIIKYLKKRHGNTRVCIEATGIYHFDLAIALSQSKDIEVMVINPRASHNFAKVLMTRSKTDVIDAENLALYAERMPFNLWVCPTDELIDLRAIARRITTLNKQKTQSKNQLHALESTQKTPKLVIEQTQALIEVFEIQVTTLRDAALVLMQDNEELKEAYTLITSIKGIAQASAIQILSEVMILPKDMSARQWVAHAGLDPRIFDSGSSVSKKPRISKVGNKYIRQALYMPALVACRFEPNIKGYYHHLINDNGLKKVQAICAVMRKLLHAIHGMLRAKKEFEGERFYTLPVIENS